MTYCTNCGHKLANFDDCTQCGYPTKRVETKELARGRARVLRALWLLLFEPMPYTLTLVHRQTWDLDVDGVLLCSIQSAAAPTVNVAIRLRHPKRPGPDVAIFRVDQSTWRLESRVHHQSLPRLTLFLSQASDTVSKRINEAIK